MTKTWFVDGQLTAQVIPEAEIYKREWVRLTDEEIWDIASDYFDADAQYDVVIAYSRVIEAKLKEKNSDSR
jgi:hypothetical protein